MEIFRKPLANLAVFDEIRDAMKKNGIHTVTGCIDSQKTHLIYGLGAEEKCRVIVCSDEQKTKKIAEEYDFFEGKTIIYPAKDLLFQGADIRGNLLTRERTEAIKRILFEENVTVITTIDAFFDHLAKPDEVLEHLLTIKTDEDADLHVLIKHLVGIGYERTDEVERPGEFAVRGGILDVFGLTFEMPHRIEFWGDMVDSIRTFDAQTQRSVEELSEVTFFPAAELPADTDEAATLFSYFDPKTTLFFLDEPNRLKERADFILKEYRDSVENRLEKGYLTADEVEELETLEKVALTFSHYRTAALCTIDLQKEIWKASSYHFIETKSAATYHNDFTLLTQDLKSYREKKYRTVLLCGSRSRAKRLAEDLREFDLNSFYTEDKNRNLSAGEILVTYGKIFQGYEYPSIRFIVIAESDIFGKEQKKRKKRRFDGEKITSFSDLTVGDPVVHESRGLGIYRGIEKIEIDDVYKDYLKVEYADHANLYIPASDLDLLQKYTGGTKHPRLNKLGGTQWQKAKAKTRAAVQEIAQELVDLYAVRQAKEGFRYGPDTVWQQEFEELFEYDETEDQLQAIADTKRDMESGRIMDRLICGDVGYGKTEVAIRAAFKAVQENKQVAVLVPTTILAEQHYHTFTQRMKDYPVRVDLLCRFRSSAEQKKTIADLKRGTVDIVIGTHRLLSKDVDFHDLGLLVVDEEQRFGVTHKEKIKQLRKNVDVLTLSATPIPRTLHMSLTGIRDMSLLEEAPTDRQPVQTYVMEYNEETVREAINRELGRGGQVYFVYNRTDTIPDMAGFLQKLSPDASVAYVHGKMNERELEERMIAFIHGEIDVLVTTTIVENGLDITNANTMIIYDADRLGLSQLYQLRGRVGRSGRTSYAFFMYRKNKLLKEQAEKRLQAIRDFSDLGSGFKIALRDLEIRGAGNLLGAKQSGHMEAVGYDLYCKMLNEAVRHLKGDITVTGFETSIDLSVDAFIPDDYIPSELQKLTIYKRIALVASEEERSDMLDELIDRFREPPEAVQNLLRIALDKALAHSLGLTEVSQKGDTFRFVFYEKADIDPTGIPALLTEAKGNLTFRPEKNPVLVYRKAKIKKGEEKENPFAVVEDVLERIKSLRA